MIKSPKLSIEEITSIIRTMPFISDEDAKFKTECMDLMFKRLGIEKFTPEQEKVMLDILDTTIELTKRELVSMFEKIRDDSL